jgi:hypothetical protein
MKFFTKYLALFFGFVSMIFGGTAFADPPDFSTLTDAVDFSTVTAAILLVFAAVATVYILMRGGEMILAKIRR